MKNLLKLLVSLTLIFAFTVLSCPNDPAPAKSVAGKGSIKRGVGYNFTTANSSPTAKSTTQWTDEEMHLLASGENPVKWFYAWGVKPNAAVPPVSAKYGVLYFPMVWNNNYREEDIREIVNNTKPRPEYILAYNEPNFRKQANMTPAAAAAAWPRLKTIAKELNLKIISPAMNFSGGSESMGWDNPLDWLDAFFKQPGVSKDDVHAIAIHAYPYYPGSLKYFVELYKEKFNKPIWVTEFCGWEISADDSSPSSVERQISYLQQAIVYLELDPMVERYAWYIPKGHEPENKPPHHNLLTDVPLNSPAAPVLTNLGFIYVNMTVCDKTRWDATGSGQKIDASQFTDCNISEHIGKVDSWSTFVLTNITLDSDKSAGWLEINTFKEKQWVEYQITVPKTKDYTLTFRYKTKDLSGAGRSVNLLVSVDGGEAETIVLPYTDDEYSTSSSSVKVKVPSGKHTLRFTAPSPASLPLAINWFSLK